MLLLVPEENRGEYLHDQRVAVHFFPLKNDNHKIKHKGKTPNKSEFMKLRISVYQTRKQYSIAGMGKQQPMDQIQPTARHRE